MGDLEHLVKPIEGGNAEIWEQYKGWPTRVIARLIKNEDDELEIGSLVDGISVNNLPLPKGSSMAIKKGDRLGLTGRKELVVE